MKLKNILGTIGAHALLVILSVIWLIPILWLVVTAFSGYPGINISHFFPSEWTLQNFGTFFLQAGFSCTVLRMV